MTSTVYYYLTLLSLKNEKHLYHVVQQGGNINVGSPRSETDLENSWTKYCIPDFKET